jgi:hypothetical protein
VCFPKRAEKLPPRPVRAIFSQEGELSAAIELRRRFLGIIDNAKARAMSELSPGGSPAVAIVPSDPAAASVILKIIWRRILRINWRGLSTYPSGNHVVRLAVEISSIRTFQM